MPAAVQLLSDESILTTWELYCQADQVITIYVRERKDPSPNASRAVSHALSLEQRRKVSQAEPAEIELRTPLRHNTCQSSDVLSRDPVRRLPTNDQVVLDLGRGKTETFSKDYLRGWIAAELSKGRTPTDISVESISSDGKTRKILLTSDIWLTPLILGGPGSSSFKQQLSEPTSFTMVQRSSALQELREESSDFDLKSRFFIRDLKTFNSDRKARNRLQGTGHRFYLGLPYFDSETVNKVLALPGGNNKSLGVELEMLMQRRTEDNQAKEICTSHDLAPIFETALEIDWEKSKKDIWKEIGDLALEGGAWGRNMGKGLMNKAGNFLQV